MWRKKKAALLSIIGTKTYNLLRGLTSPQKPKDISYDQIVEILEGHLSPTPLEIAERFRFYKRCQSPSENVNTFLATIKKLTEHCNFEEFLSQALRDRYVCGLANESIQKKLLCESDLTIDEALNLAKSMEQAIKDASEIHQTPDSTTSISGQQTTVFKLDINSKKCQLWKNWSCTQSLQSRMRTIHCQPIVGGVWHLTRELWKI